MRHTPGHQDRLIGRQEIGGYGGGRVLCPIFDSATAYKNFGFDGSSVPAPEPIDPYEAPGLVAVLNVPTLVYYSLDTHYGLNDIHDQDDDQAYFLRENWRTLVQRAIDEPTPELVAAFLRTAVVRVRYTSSATAKPDPRLHLMDVQTNMHGQMVPEKSYAIALPNNARRLDRAAVIRRIERLRQRTKRPLENRLGD